MERPALRHALDERAADDKYAAELLDRYKANVILGYLHPVFSDPAGSRYTLSELRAKIEVVMDHEAHSNGPAGFWFDFLRGRWFRISPSFEKDSRSELLRSCAMEAPEDGGIATFCRDMLGISAKLFDLGRNGGMVILPDHTTGAHGMFVIESPNPPYKEERPIVTIRSLRDADLCHALLHTWRFSPDPDKVRIARETLINLFWRAWDACVSEADECARNNTCLYEEDGQVTCSCPHVTLILSDRPRDFRILQGSQFGDGLYAPQRVHENGKRLERWLYSNILPEHADFSRCCEPDHLEHVLSGRGWPFFRPQRSLKAWIHLGMMELDLHHALLCGKTLLVILPREITVLPNEVSLFQSA